jgi:uncharacterized phage protein (TIGR02216 family)
MTAGLGTLRLAPHDFWSMTPRELDAALRGALGLVAATPGDDAFRSEGANGGISGCELKSSSLGKRLCVAPLRGEIYGPGRRDRSSNRRRRGSFA